MEYRDDTGSSGSFTSDPNSTISNDFSPRDGASTSTRRVKADSPQLPRIGGRIRRTRFHWRPEIDYNLNSDVIDQALPDFSPANTSEDDDGDEQQNNDDDEQYYDSTEDISVEVGRSPAKSTRGLDDSRSSVMSYYSNSIRPSSPAIRVDQSPSPNASPKAATRHSSKRAVSESLRRDAQLRQASLASKKNLDPQASNLTPTKDQRRVSEMSPKARGTYDGAGGLDDERSRSPMPISGRATRFGNKPSKEAEVAVHKAREEAFAEQATQDVKGMKEDSRKPTASVNNTPAAGDTATQQSIVLPDFLPTSELTSGVHDVSTSSPARQNKVRTTRFVSPPNDIGDASVTREHHPLNFVPIPEDENSLFSSLKMLQVKAAELEFEKKSAEIHAEHLRRENESMKARRAHRKDRRDRDRQQERVSTRELDLQREQELKREYERRDQERRRKYERRLEQELQREEELKREEELQREYELRREQEQRREQERREQELQREYELQREQELKREEELRREYERRREQERRREYEHRLERELRREEDPKREDELKREEEFRREYERRREPERRREQQERREQELQREVEIQREQKHQREQEHQRQEETYRSRSAEVSGRFSALGEDETLLSVISENEIAELRKKLEAERLARKDRPLKPKDDTKRDTAASTHHNLPKSSPLRKPSVKENNEATAQSAFADEKADTTQRSFSIPVPLRKSSAKETANTTQRSVSMPDPWQKSSVKENRQPTVRPASAGNDMTTSSKGSMAEEIKPAPERRRRHSDRLANTISQRRSHQNTEDVTSDFIIQDITFHQAEAVAAHPGEWPEAAERALDNVARHEGRNCTVCKRVVPNGNTCNHAQNVPKPVPVSDRISKSLAYEEDHTLRPSQDPSVALATVLKPLEDELSHMRMKLAAYQDAYYKLDPSMSRRKRKSLRQKIEKALEDADMKADQIYSLYDVLEGQKKARHQMTEKQMDDTLQSIGIDVEQAQKPAENAPHSAQVESDSDEEELPWEGIESTGHASGY
ncbi:hypothetical protein PHISP_02616 [Aspergillus sp. HF37]|nr:hypothetical protein PHISP_02616 [Aspergillus sp. HF37]